MEGTSAFLPGAHLVNDELADNQEGIDLSAEDFVDEGCSPWPCF
jgi:hypothetical protein